MSQRNGNPSVSVIICTKCEEKNLPHILPKIPEWVDEIVLVDGHSTDRTVKVARQLRPDIRVVYQTGKGKGDALRCGFRHARGDIVVTIDADGSMNPGEIIDFVIPLRNGCDFTKGSRFMGNGSTVDMEKHRILGNRLFTLLTNLLYGSKYTDLAYGYNAFKRRALERMRLKSDGFEIETEMGIKARKTRLRVLEIPSVEQKRLSGQSNLNSFRDGWRILKIILKERLHR
jgi:glycosyltransferase involved in cell wall biosynthesis